MATAKDKEKKSGSEKLLKYMGSADARTFSKTDSFGGRLQGGLGVDLEFTVENNHVADVSDLDDDALELLMEEQERDGSGGFIPAFVEVTNKRKVPDNEWQKRWRPRNLPDPRNVSAVLGSDDEGVHTSGLGEGSTSTTGSGTGASTNP